MKKPLKKRSTWCCDTRTSKPPSRVKKNNPLAPGPEAIEARYQEAKKRERGAYRTTITEIHKHPYRKAFESMKGLTMTLDEMSSELDKRQLQLKMQPEGPQA